MNLQALRWVRSLDVSAQEAALLTNMATYADQNGELYPHVETIAAAMKASPRTVYRLIAKSEKNGRLIRHSKMRKHGNVYILPFSENAIDHAEKIRRCGTVDCHVRRDAGVTSNLPLLSRFIIENEESDKIQRTRPQTPDALGAGKIEGDAQAPFDDDEDAESAAIILHGQGGREVSLAFDRGAESAPNDDRQRGGGKMARSSNSSARPRAEGVSRDDLERWDRFVEEWPFQPGRENLDPPKRAFLALSAHDQELCIKGAKALQIPPNRRVFAVTFIRQRQWAFLCKGAPRAQAGESEMIASLARFSDVGATRLPDGKVFLRPGSSELAAWEEYERRKFGKARGGCIRPTLWPPEDDFTEARHG
jgi:hypothetical protein